MENNLLEISLMRSRVACAFGAVGFLLALADGVCAQEAAPTSPAPSAAAAPAASTDAGAADVTLGGEVVLRLRASAGGMTPQQRVDTITSRLTSLLAIPKITPADVVVYTPPGKAPVIYALGHRLITVDAATVQAAGGGKALTLAQQWAARLQQVLPRVNYRPSNIAEPQIPAHPPLLVTSDFAKVGGSVGAVTLRNKVVIRLRGPQPGGMTAAERAETITERLKRVANTINADTADPVQVVGPTDGQAGGVAQLVVAGAPILNVEPAEAKAAGMAAPQQLATAWAKNIRTALDLPAPTPPASTGG